jgi:hypothetical protein
MDTGELAHWADEYLRPVWSSFSSDPWNDTKFLIAAALAIAALAAVFKVLRRLPEIRETMREFNEGRGRLWDLRQMIYDIREFKPVMEEMKDVLPHIQRMSGEIRLLQTQLEVTLAKVGELQAELSSERSIETDAAAVAAAGSIAGENFEENWEQLREFWRRNTKRIEYVIGRIPNKRIRLSYDAMSRRNYKEIINKLEAAGYLGPAAATASRKLIDIFNAFRPQNRPVHDADVQPVRVLDMQLDQAIVPYSTVAAAEAEPLLPILDDVQRNDGRRVSNGAVSLAEPSQPST